MRAHRPEALFRFGVSLNRPNGSKGWLTFRERRFTGSLRLLDGRAVIARNAVKGGRRRTSIVRGTRLGLDPSFDRQLPLAAGTFNCDNGRRPMPPNASGHKELLLDRLDIADFRQ